MYYFVGVLFIIVGIAINVAINRRRFYRRGQGGLQQFKNYRSSVGITFIERIGKLLAFFLILIGFGAVLLGYSMNKDKEKPATEVTRPS